MSAGFMGNVNDTNLRLVKLQGKEEDYTGKDGLLYCGKCHQPKEVYFSREKAVLFGHDRRPKECACQKKQRIEREIVEKEQRHLEIVEALKRRGFSDLAMRRWTFANDNGKFRQMDKAHFYVEHWEEMKAGNIGCGHTTCPDL